MTIDEWVEEVLGAQTAPQRVALLVPRLKALGPSWEAVWQAYEDSDDAVEHARAVTRDGVAALERYLAGAAIDPEALSALCEASDALAREVGENGQQLDGFEDAGSAHAFTALLTVALHEALGEPHPEHSLEEVAEGLLALVQNYPSIEAAFH